MCESPTIAAATSTWRFSIRSLLIVVTVVCVLLAPYHWLGGGYLFSLLCSVILIGLSVKSYQSAGIATPIFISLVGGALGFFIAIGSLTLLLSALANFLGCLICAPIKPRTRNFTIVLCTFGLIPYAFQLHLGIEERLYVNNLRLQHPIKSLEERLSFEKGHSTESVINTQLPLKANIETTLTSFEQRAQGRSEWRIRNLKMLHDEAYYQFTIASGFGPMRMLKPGDYNTRIHDREATFLPLSLTSSLMAKAFPTNFVDLHETSVIDSFRPETFGYVKTVSEVAGFVPHGSAKLAKEIGAVDEKNDSHWQLTRLDLVGLLKHDEPRVYIADTIPLMNELESLPHRSLNEFEVQALPQLDIEKDTVIEEFAGGARMLGAVRAGNDCLQCHSGPRGKLLGAFSYEFRNLK